ncbi:MAG: porin family protein [Bacteroides pyogenes]|uniref:porin family protein n=1 Tax=Bacteroides pyogenes TaxID=310300 RepID=UPI002A91419A|nr:porin family protein [Bacteroides pyogenes]MDY5353398.1 porin family protein [Bacteroides pyogenes]
MKFTGRIQLLLLCGLFTIPYVVYAQNSSMDRVNAPNTQKFNWGVKAGFNSTMFIVSKLKINDVTIDEVQNNYKIGYFLSLFTRVNIKNSFIQPEVSYNVSKGEIAFDKLGVQHPDIEPDIAAVQSTLHSIDFPVLYGYNVVKKGPYEMSVFIGSKFRYLWRKKSEIQFKNFDQKEVVEELHPLNASIVVGIGVNISRIFFDFRYEQGVVNMSKSITYSYEQTDKATGVNPIIFKRRDSALSFSLGLLL